MGSDGVMSPILFSLFHDVVGPGPGAARGQPINVNAPGSHQTPENIQQMKKRMEQELKSDKYKSNNNKGYVFTLMPLYAIGVGVFAAYKFLKVTTYTCNIKLLEQNLGLTLGKKKKKVLLLFLLQIKSSDDKVQKDKFAKGAKKSAEAGVCQMF